ncbi:protocadherin-23 [Gadus chalcogrammus]|uniref:protocadherin-23 n=1 Tax=Gadus chalcogrammus TaxID=1042646 RepID=UPI0024C2835F|nr:protocadherin-23 [Gadus chalcogrammus]
MGHKNASSALHLLLVLSLLGTRSLAQVSNLTLSIEEGLPARTIVGDISAALSAPSSSGFFISESRDSYVLIDLEINADTGIISTAIVLDREIRDKYEFVAATLTGEVIKVKIKVNDVNDHSPVFPSDTIDLEISELSPPGSRFELEGAEDQDEGEFGTQGYRISEADMRGLFQLEYRNGSDNPFHLDLLLTSRLDREALDFYSLTIEAFDGGIPARTGTLHVNIHVLDENDHPPVFNQTEYHASVSEDAPVNSTVCRVHATDRDLGINGLITYEINRRQSDSGEMFSIDERTGVIYINKPLDFETQSFHELIISARDNGVQSEFSSTFVGVKVLNINDNTPTVNILFLSESGEAAVSEGAGLGEYVARILVSDGDADLGDSQKVSVTLQGGEGRFTLKQTDHFLFALCVDGPLDREERERFELTLRATDQAGPSLSTEVTFDLMVTDVNDCPPLFERDAYTVRLAEDVPPGTSVVQVKARDGDEGPNASVRYSLLGPGGSGPQRDPLPFTVDPSSGLIVTLRRLDREREAAVRLLVEAGDGGEPALSSTATVTVVIEDVNDNEPVFQQQLYNVSVPEHSQLGSCFLQVVATDADGPDFASLQYSLSDGFDRKDLHPLFHINADTGEVCVSQDIDRDTGQTSHDILVKAVDQGGLSAQTYVHIEVEDLNDNAPVFNPEQYATSVSSHAPPDTEILTAIATDPDSGSYGRVTYELLPSDLSGLFTLDGDTGTLYLRSTVAHLGTASVTLSLSARDGGGRTSATPARLTVNVVGSAQAPAVFQRSRYSFSVAEDAPPGTSVGTVTAVCPGSSPEPVTYCVSSGDPQGWFSVHPDSGLISTRRALDHEAQRYALLVLQSSSGLLFSSTQVNVSVADVNDHAPAFPAAREALTLSRSTPPGAVLFIAHARDADSGANGRVSYHLTDPGNDDAGEKTPFAVDPVLGTLTLAGSLRTSARRAYALEVVARDEGRPPLAARLTLEVTVDQAGPEDDALAFESLVYQVEIGEGYRKDARVIQVKAHLGGPQGAHASGGPGTTGITYSLEPEPGFPAPPFRVHARSGWLYLYQSLDYESEPGYGFRVVAAAGEDDTRSSATASVRVQVLDANDNAPVFGREAYYFTASEGSAPQGLVGTVQATDRDAQKNAELSYMLLSDGKYFRINTKTGEIMNWVALDREQHSQHSLKVMVSDHGRPRLNATATVHVSVTDVNDNPPRFTHLPSTNELNVQMWAGLPPGSLVTTMFAKDPDAGENGTVTFSLRTEADGLGVFEIDPQSGDITLKAASLQPIVTHYTLEVMAKDGGLNSLEEVAIVHVQVHRGASVFDGSQHQIARRLSVREDAKPAATVGSAAIIAVGARFRYSIAEGDGSIHFGVDPSSGDIYVNQPLDYESAAQYFLVVLALEAEPREPPGLNVSVLVSVSLEDVNDHTPWFPDDLVTLGLREDVAVGTLVFAFHAKDADGSLGNSDLRYSLSHDRGSHSESPGGPSPPFPFAVDPRTGRLTVVAPLDRETTPSLAFTVTAFDREQEGEGAGPGGVRRQASVTAQVFLLDVNDNRPVLVSADAVRVAEDAEVGGLLHHVVALDRDLGENGRVSYSIVDGDSQGVFRLEENTGFLYLSSPLDHEVSASHRLIVWAGDGGVPRLSCTQTLTVLVEDVNDLPPVFQREVYAASVAENRNPGEPVVSLCATDGDSGKNAEMQYSLLPGPGYDLFSVHPQTGQVTTTTQLDREQQPTFTLRVLARDGGSPGLSSTTTVECSVLDENDNPPRFVQTSFQVSLPENLPPGVLYIGQASDPDLGENSTIHYSIDGEGSRGGRFAVDALSGAVSSTEVLDREEQGSYTLTLRATDGGPQPLSSTAQLHLRLLDQNDNGPSFSRDHYHAAVAEGLPAGTAVLELRATDPDQGPNGEVSYSLEEDGGSQGAFAVDGATGLIRTTRPLDRESRAQYTLRALATDGCAVGPQSAEVTVTVEVEDVNDNAPACPRDPVSAWVAATRTWRPDQVLATVRATDLDQGENGTVRYAWSQGDGLFALNQASGEIRLRRPLRAGFPGRRMHVLAVDRGEPELTSTCLVFVHLRGGLDGLLFTKKVYNATVIENSRAGTFVAKIEAVDQANSGLRIGYSIFSGNEREVFAINGNTGEITVQKPRGLDFEEDRLTQLVVLADSGAETAHSRVAITLKDVNDNAPLFDYAYYRTAVWEGQVHNTYIMQVFASDADSSMNGLIEYSIVSGNQNNAFVLDPARGILATNVLLDREITPLYRLVVQAADRGSPALSGTTIIRVQVVDVNDNSPAIPPMTPVVVAENLPVGYVVTQVTANDVDLGSTISFSLLDHGDSDSASGCFAIDRYSGVITLTRALDYEERTEHVLGVRASDAVHQATGEVLVTVLDANDNAPVFERVSYQVEASEEAPANTLIATLSATDLDSGVNGKVSYRLLNSPPLSFNIHPDNGSVFTTESLRDIPHSSPIQLLVEARDGGDPARSTITSVDVVVLDANDHAPAFHQDTYTVSIPEDTSPGTTLLTLSAEDADWAPDNTHLGFAIVKGNEERRFFLEVNVLQSGVRPDAVGRLVLCGPLDRETQGSYTLTIRATDRGAPPLNGSTVVMVTVTDVNDNAPMFVNTEYHSQVSEDSLAGTSLVQISAHDPDMGVNGLVHYEIISGNGKGHLGLDPNSGVISVNGSLDYEEESKYTLTVRASDGGISEDRKVAFAVVFVTVLDENDNTPYFMFATVNCSVSENLPAFSPVCSVFAIDHDSGAYGRLTYSVLSACFTDYGSGSPERKEAFAVDSLTGDISTRQTFDYELEREFCLLVEARDKGGKAATLRVVVAVQGVDEFSPVFTQRQYNFRLPEDAKPGLTVGQVRAMDSDGGVDGTVEYSFADPLASFSVDRTLGSVFVSGPVYRQRAGLSVEDTVQVIVTARSPRQDSKSATCLVSINISNSAVALVGVPFDVRTAGLTVSILALLLLLFIVVGLLLRYKMRQAVVKKAAAVAADLHNDTGSFDLPSDSPQNAVSLQELLRADCASREMDISNPCRHSDSSGRGSAEGETAEDQEIQWINTFYCRKSPLSLRSKGELHNPDDDTIEDCISCYSIEAAPEHLACASAGPSTALASAESLHNFKEEGGGEGLLRTASRVRDLDQSMRVRGHIALPEPRAPPGSLSSLVCPEDKQHSSYDWDYLIDWEPRFQTLASVFTDIALLRDEDLRGGVEDTAAIDAGCLMYPPPLITGVAQPGIRNVPPRMPGRVPSLSRRPSYPKYAYAPLARNTGLTPCAMIPSFSPSLSLLTGRTPNASPVVSEAMVGGIRLHSGPHTASLLESEIQV